VVSFTPQPLYPRYPLHRKLAGPQRWRRKKVPAPVGNRIPVVQPGLVPNTLPALKCEILPLSSNYDGVAKPQPCYQGKKTSPQDSLDPYKSSVVSPCRLCWFGPPVRVKNQLRGVRSHGIRSMRSEYCRSYRQGDWGSIPGWGTETSHRNRVQTALGPTQSPIHRVPGEETIDHLASECPILTKDEYIIRHDKVCTHLYYSICKKLGTETAENWYTYLRRRMNMKI
jgi:hypothetical protein